MTAVQLDLVDLVEALSTPERVYLRRVDPSRNMSRFYTMAIERTLFGEFALVREWGRIGRGGQTKSTVFPSGREAESTFSRLRRAKERRGYSCGRSQSSAE